jgi:hypothetical protein
MLLVIDRIVQGEPVKRSIKIALKRSAGKPDILRITDEFGRQEGYRLTEFVPDRDFAGRAFELVKIDGTVYQCLAAKDPKACLCDCIGFERYGMCKHIHALRGLIERTRGAAAGK